MAGEQIAAKYENWLRLMTLIHYVGFEICRNILHTIENLPVNGAQLYFALIRQQTEFNKLLRKKVLSQTQFDLIFPANGATDIKEFDITLFTCVITVMFGKQKYKRVVNELKKWRNEEFHQGEILMNNLEFNNKWNGFLLLAAGYGVNAGNFADLKTCAMDRISQHNNRFVYSEILKNRIEQKHQNIRTLWNLDCINEVIQDLIRYVIGGVFVLAIFLISTVVYFAYFQNKCKTSSISLERRLNSSSEMLKKNYIQTIGQQNLKSIHETYRFKKRFYVDLAIVPKNNSAKNLPTISRQFFIFSQLNQNGTVTIDQLLNAHKDNNMVMIQGPGGVGKSFTLETAALHWAEGKIWSDVKFVFLLKFRELNLFVGNSFKESLCKIYEQVFKDLKFEDLENVAEKIVFLMDGIDEFSGLNETLSQEPYGNDSSVTSGLYKLLKSNYFPGRHLIMAGRAFSCEQIRTKFKELSIESYSILGFSSPQVKLYIDSYFELNQTKASQLIDTIKQQSNLDLMSRTPAFLWSLCELHQSNAFHGIQTVTPLFTLQLTLFFQHHLHNLNLTFSQNNSMEIYKAPAVQKLVGELSKIAKMTLEEGVVLIDLKEFKNSATIDLLENSGLINRVRTTMGEKIQFHHMLMQEFLTAIFFLQSPNIDKQKHFKEDKYSGVAPLYAGLYGGCLKDSRSSIHVKRFVKFLSICPQNNDDHYTSFINGAPFENFLDIFYEYQNEMNPVIVDPWGWRLNLYSQVGRNYIYNSNFYIENFVDVPDGHFYGNIHAIPCANAPTFYIANQVLERCDIRKYKTVSNYIANCDLQEQSNDVRRFLRNFQNHFFKLKQSFFYYKSYCNDIRERNEEIQKFGSLLRSMKFQTNKIVNQNFVRNWLDEYISWKLCGKTLFENVDYVKYDLMHNIVLTDISSTHSIICKYSRDFDFLKGFTIKMYLISKDILRSLNSLCFENWLEVSTDVNECKLDTLGRRDERFYFCKYLSELTTIYNNIAEFKETEKRLNETIFETCYPTKRIIIQKEKDKSLLQIKHFYNLPGNIQRQNVIILKLVSVNDAADIKPILPFLCNVESLNLYDSWNYEVESFKLIISTLMKCNETYVNELVVDYFIARRFQNDVIVNELALKEVYNVERLTIRMLTNSYRAIGLLRNNIVNHNKLPKFRLKKLHMYLTYFNSHSCVFLCDIMKHMREIEIIPFNKYLFGRQQIESCKEFILKELNKGNSASVELFFLQEWKLVIGKEYYYWKLRDDFDLNDRWERLVNEQLLQLSLCLMANLVLCSFASTSVFLIDRCFGFDGFAGLDFFIFFIIMILFLFGYWIPGEKLLSYQDPIYFSKARPI